MLKLIRILIVGVLITAMSFALPACGQTSKKEESNTTSSEKKEQQKKLEPITIKYPTAWIGAHAFAKYFKEEMARFNQKYGEEVIVKIEEIPEDAAYDEKMKVLISANDLPDVIVANSFDIRDLALKANLLVDMKPLIEADEDWKNSLDTEILDDWSSQSGKWYGISSHLDVVSYFYNKELFRKAGITEPAKTWDEFFTQCDKLLEAGITPLALETKDKWIGSLWLIALFGTDGEAGNKLANTSSVDNYETKEFINAVSNLQKMYQKYTTADAVGLDYAGATNYFMNEKVAMITDGPWAIPNFSNPEKAVEGFKDKVGVALYPNSGAYKLPGYAYFCASKDDSHIQAALKFIKHFTDEEGQIARLKLQSTAPVSKKVDLSKLEIDPLLSDLLNQYKKSKYTFANPWRIYRGSVVSILSQELAALAYGKVTPEQFAKDLTVESLKQAK